MASSVVAAQKAAVPAQQENPLVASVAKSLGMNVTAFYLALRSTVLPKVKDPETKQLRNPTEGEVYGFLSVVNAHKLNPFIQEIYAFPKKGGGMQAVVGIDGWLRIINSNPDFDGMEMDWTFRAAEKAEVPRLESCTITIHSKSRRHPTVCTEFFDECYRQTEPWNNMPRRMLRNRTIAQGARIAFGISGLMLDDEAETIRDTDYEVVASSPTAPASNLDDLAEELGQAMDAQKPRTAAEKAPEPPESADYREPKEGKGGAPRDALFDNEPSPEDPG